MRVPRNKLLRILLPVGLAVLVVVLIAAAMPLAGLPSVLDWGKANHKEAPAEAKASARLVPDRPGSLHIPPDVVQSFGIQTTLARQATQSRPLPPLPKKLSPAQAARVAEIFDFLHRGLSFATENMRADDNGNEVQLSFTDWQKVLAVQMLLARYLRAVSEPESLGDSS